MFFCLSSDVLFFFSELSSCFLPQDQTFELAEYVFFSIFTLDLCLRPHGWQEAESDFFSKYNLCFFPYVCFPQHKSKKTIFL